MSNRFEKTDKITSKIILYEFFFYYILLHTCARPCTKVFNIKMHIICMEIQKYMIQLLVFYNLMGKKYETSNKKCYYCEIIVFVLNAIAFQHVTSSSYSLSYITKLNNLTILYCMFFTSVTFFTHTPPRARAVYRSFHRKNETNWFVCIRLMSIEIHLVTNIYFVYSNMITNTNTH